MRETEKWKRHIIKIDTTSVVIIQFVMYFYSLHEGATVTFTSQNFMVWILT